ncbi:MAG: hypothetical protein WC876_06490 [Candidatus Thermoplasmatota archaeon]
MAKATATRGDDDFSKVMDLWVASDLKIQSLNFFHENPGVIETLEGLARRLGTNVDGLRKEIADHITLGIIKEQKTGAYTLLVFDRRREGEVQGAIADRVRKLAAAKGRPTK